MIDTILGSVKTGLYFLAVLSVLVLVHEWGHFFVAKLCRMRVDDFSLFFGKVLIRLGVHDGTEYNIRSIPMGGFVKIAGMEPDDISNGAPIFRRETPKDYGAKKQFLKTLQGLNDEALANINFDNISERIELAVADSVEEGRLTPDGKAELQTLLASTSITDDEQRYMEAVVAADDYVPDHNGYNQKPLWQRAATIFAGPFMSLCFGYLLLCVMGMTGRLPYDQKAENIVASIDHAMPGYKAGLREADKIVRINDVPIVDGDTMMDIIHENVAKPLTITVERGKASQVLHVTPQPSPEKQILTKNGKPILVNGKPLEETVGIIGFAPHYQMLWKHYTPAEAIVRGTEILQVQVVGTFIVLTHPKLAATHVTGPVGIVGEIHANSKEGPWRVLLTAALLSVGLGIMNLLPIPILDGGQLLLLAIEGIRRRKLTSREVYGAQLVGLVLIGMLFVFVMFKDIKGVFFH